MVSGGFDDEVRCSHFDGDAVRVTGELRRRTASAGASGHGSFTRGSTTNDSTQSVRSASQSGSEKSAQRYGRRELSLAVRPDRFPMNTRAIVRALGLAVLVVAVDCKSPTPPSQTGTPVVNAGQDASVEVGTPFQLAATFTDTTANGAPWDYEIAWGDGATSSGTKNTVSTITGSHTFTQKGDYQVTVSVTNSRAKTGTGSLTVGATDAPAPVILAAGDIGDCTRTTDNATGQLISTLS